MKITELYDKRGLKESEEYRSILEELLVMDMDINNQTTSKNSDKKSTPQTSIYTKLSLTPIELIKVYNSYINEDLLEVLEYKKAKYEKELEFNKAVICYDSYFQHINGKQFIFVCDLTDKNRWAHYRYFMQTEVSGVSVRGATMKIAELLKDYKRIDRSIFEEKYKYFLELQKEKFEL